MHSEIRSAQPAAQAPLWQHQSWLNKATLESVREVNEQVLELLRTQCVAGVPQPFLLRDVGALLLDMDAESVHRAAGSGVLLVDAGLGDSRLWADAIVGAVNDRHSPPSPPFFTVDGAVAVMRLVMTQAWHLARSEPAAARLLLGVSVANLAVIGGCTLSRLTGLAENRSQWLRPRWESRPGIWCDLLRAASKGESGALARIRVRGLQLLAADARQG